MGKRTDVPRNKHSHLESPIRKTNTDTTETTTISKTTTTSSSSSSPLTTTTTITTTTTSTLTRIAGNDNEQHHFGDERKATSTNGGCCITDDTRILKHGNDDEQRDYPSPAHPSLSPSVDADDDKKGGKEKKEKKKEEKEKKEEEKEKVGDTPNSTHPGLPVDRGWAWVIMIAQFVMMMMLVGYSRSLSILFLEFLVMFHVPMTSVTIVFGVMTVSFGIGNMLVSHVLLSRFSARKLQLTGSIINSAFVALTALAPNMAFLAVTHAFIGFSHALMCVPGITLLGHYFHNRRSLAIAVANTGISVSSLLFPPLTQHLLHIYGPRGALLLLAGIELQAVIAASLMRPVSWYSSKKRAAGPEGDSRRPREEDQPIQETKFSDASGEGLQENDGECTTTRLLDDCDHVEIVMDNLLHQTRVISQPLSISLPEKSALSNSSELFPVSLETSDYHHRRRPLNRHYARQRSCPVEHLHSTARQGNKRDSSSTKISALSTSVVNVCGSVMNIPTQDAARSASSSYVQQDDTGPDELKPETRGSCCRRRGVKFVISQIIDASLFKNWLFLLIIVYVPLGLSAGFLAFYFPSLAVEQGFSRSEAAMLVSVIGGTELVSRLCVGFLADLQLIKRTHLVAFCMTILGLTSQFSRFFSSYELLAMFAVMLGLLGEVCGNLFAVVIIDLLGLPLLGKVMGLVLVFNSAFASLNHVLIGALADSTGSFAIPYHYIGSCLFLSSFILLTEPLARRLETKRVQKLECNGVSVRDPVKA